MSLDELRGSGEPSIPLPNRGTMEVDSGLSRGDLHTGQDDLDIGIDSHR